MTPTQPENSNKIDYERLKQELRGSDFDGHTSFESITFTKRFAWLSKAAVSTYYLAKSNPASGCADFFQPK
jgi:hypothetical protein